MMFDSFEAYDVQETRRVSREEGEQLYLIKQIIKKIQKEWIRFIVNNLMVIGHLNAKCLLEPGRGF